MSVVFNWNGTLLASGAGDYTIKLWNVQTKTEIASMIGHTNYVRSIVFNKHGTILASGSHDNTIKLWNIERK